MVVSFFIQDFSSTVEALFKAQNWQAAVCFPCLKSILLSPMLLVHLWVSYPSLTEY